MGNLTAARVKALMDKPGRYNDGDGLILFVNAPGKASWVARIQHNKKRRDYGLGSANLYSLAEARNKLWEVRRTLADGGDPIAQKRAERNKQARLGTTFKDAAEAFLKVRQSKDLADKSQQQAENLLKRYAYPSLGRLQVQSIDAETLADCIAPVWVEKGATGDKLRSLILGIMRLARPDAGFSVKDLGAKVSERLPKQAKKGHHTAMPYAELPPFMAKLAEKTGMGALALRMAILCTSRSGEVRFATWGEIDFDAGTWTIPAERMKSRKEHVVPLSPQAMALLDEMKAIRRAGTDLIFPNGKGKALSDMALTKTLRDMGTKWTAHGFRSTFTDWAAEQTNVPEEIREAALAHTVSNKVTKAYLRTTFFDKRRDLMNAWGRFAAGEADNVVKLEAAR